MYNYKDEITNEILDVISKDNFKEDFLDEDNDLINCPALESYKDRLKTDISGVAIGSKTCSSKLAKDYVLGGNIDLAGIVYQNMGMNFSVDLRSENYENIDANIRFYLFDSCFDKAVDKFTKSLSNKDVSDLKDDVKTSNMLNKWVNLKVIQGNYEGKWTDLDSYDINDKQDMNNYKVNIKSYRENENVPIRSIERKVINPEWFDYTYPELVLKGNRFYEEISNFEINSDKKLDEYISEIKSYKDFLNQQNNKSKEI